MRATRREPAGTSPNGSHVPLLHQVSKARVRHRFYSPSILKKNDWAMEKSTKQQTMWILMLGIAAAAISAGIVWIASASSSASKVPRFALDNPSAQVNDVRQIRIKTADISWHKEVRLYLVPSGIARVPLSRFDPQAMFVGVVRSAPDARLSFTVPPLGAGAYRIAFWCQRCGLRSSRLGVDDSAVLRVAMPAGEGCPSTVPNGNRPPGAPSYTGWRLHGNGELWALLPVDGTLVTNPLGGLKLVWFATKTWYETGGAPFTVTYWPLGTTEVIKASTSSFDNQPATSVARMSMTPGCWEIRGRLQDVTLSFIANVVRGTS